VATAVLASSCGVPIDTAPTAIPQSQVPAALSVAPATLPSPNPHSQRYVNVTVFLVNGLQELVPVTVSIGRPAGFQAILTSLADGPDARATSLGYGTDLPTGVGLTALRASPSGVVVVQVSADFLAQGGQTAIGEYAQVVWTLFTSLPTVGIRMRAVQFYANGAPTGALLADGQLVTRPVTATDYKSLLAPTP